jgi:hypothetical protein
VTAAGALRDLPIAHFFQQLSDDTLIEVVLVSCTVTTNGATALVSFVPHGCHPNPLADLPLISVPADWFGELLPSSVFMDIPDDLSAITPTGVGLPNYGRPSVRPLQPEQGFELAARWRANKRPIVTTVSFIHECIGFTPAHLLNFALDACEALHLDKYDKSSRLAIATYCELIASHLIDSAQTPPPKQLGS